MRYLNTSNVQKYCMHARRMLGPAQLSSDATFLREALEEAVSSEPSLGVVLSGKELELVGMLLDKHVKSAGFDPSDVQAALDDPGGLKSMALKEAAERSEKMREYREFVRADKEFERMVNCETTEDAVMRAREVGKIDVSSMDVSPGRKPRNLREAMALNAKLDIARKAAGK